MPKGIYVRGERKPVSEETKKKISQALMGHTFSPETIKKFSEMRRGKSARNKGIPHKKETIDKIRASLLNNKGPRWNGGRSYHKDGYIYIKSHNHPNKDARGYVFQHRLVMEEHIGRYLNGEEVVHHINGITNDNRIDNLQLFRSAKEHNQLHSAQRRKNSNLHTVLVNQ